MLPANPLAKVLFFVVSWIGFAAMAVFLYRQHNNERLHRAVMRNDVQAIKQILNEAPELLGSATGRFLAMTPLQLAAYHGNTEAIETLIERGADVNGPWRCAHKPDNWYNPLMITAMGGHSRAAKILLKSGTQVNWKSNLGETAVDIATKNNHQDLNKLFRQLGGKSGKEF